MSACFLFFFALSQTKNRRRKRLGETRESEWRGEIFIRNVLGGERSAFVAFIGGEGGNDEMRENARIHGKKEKNNDNLSIDEKCEEIGKSRKEK